MSNQHVRTGSLVKEDTMITDHTFAFIPFGSYPLVFFGTSNAY